MLSAQEKKEKEQFFRDLDRLTAFGRENEAEIKPDLSFSDIVPKKATDPLNAKSSKTIPTLTAEVNEQTAHRRKRASSQDFSVPATRSDPPPRLDRAATLPEHSPGKPIPRPKRMKEDFTDLSNLKARMKGEGYPKLKRLPKWAANRKPIPVDKQIFDGLVFFFVPNNDDDPGTRIRIHLAMQHGAQWAHRFCEEVTHIIVTDDELDTTRVAKSFFLNRIPQGPPLLRMSWVLESTSSRYIKETFWERFQVTGGTSLGNAKEDGSRSKAELPKKDVNVPTPPDPLKNAISDVLNGAQIQESLGTSSDSDGDDCDENGPVGRNSSTNESTSKKKATYLCMESHSDSDKGRNPNDQTMKMLQEMATTYDRTGDQWRMKAFRQAIGKLRKQDRLIWTSQEARNIGIGESVAAQVEEIVATGRYRRLEYAQNDPRTQIVKLFTGVHGAGETTAHKWIAQGYRTLDDLRQKAELNDNQRIGLEHYNDFQQRIPRSEVNQHAAVVEVALKAADPSLQLIIGGSYRRGSKDSGDIDCIIFKPDAEISHIRTLMLDTVIPKLLNQGFLKVALASGHSSNDDSSKWHGASCLPNMEVWRRIDFLFVPWSELGAALIYFTGNDIFNRSIRFLAGKKGMRLNQHGLFKDVMRGRRRQRITDGTLVESHDEKRIFDILGVPYRPPEERNV